MAYTELAVRNAKAKALTTSTALVQADKDDEIEKLTQVVNRQKTKEKKLTEEHAVQLATSTGVTVASAYLWNLANGAAGDETGVWNVFGGIPGDVALGTLIGGLSAWFGKGLVKDVGVGLGAGGIASFAARHGMMMGLDIRHKREAAAANPSVVAQVVGPAIPRQMSPASGSSYDPHTGNVTTYAKP